MRILLLNEVNLPLQPHSFIHSPWFPSTRLTQLCASGVQTKNEVIEETRQQGPLGWETHRELIGRYLNPLRLGSHLTFLGVALKLQFLASTKMDCIFSLSIMQIAVFFHVAT